MNIAAKLANPAEKQLTRISHQLWESLKHLLPPNISSDFFGNVYEHSLQEPLKISKEQTVQPSGRAGEKYGLNANLKHSGAKREV